MEEIMPVTEPARLRAELLELARRQLALPAELPAEADLAEHLDSMQRLSLVVAIEDHYRVAFEPEDDEAVRSLDDAARVLHMRLLQKEGQEQDGHG
jgi:acyl carrier protein